MEQISSEQHHVDVLLLGQAHDLMKALPAVVPSYRIALHVTDMAIGGHKDADSIRGCVWSEKKTIGYGILTSQSWHHEMRKSDCRPDTLCYCMVAIALKLCRVAVGKALYAKFWEDVTVLR